MTITIDWGIWTEMEDLILKQAVERYGKNQWDRISSLLVRKSAEQCEARWCEWLDPSIDKEELIRNRISRMVAQSEVLNTSGAEGSVIEVAGKSTDTAAAPDDAT